MSYYVHAVEISGQGFLKTNGGSIRTCAGNNVYLNKITVDDKNNIIIDMAIIEKYYTDIKEYTEGIVLFKKFKDNEGEAVYKQALEDTKVKIKNLKESITKSKYIHEETMCDAQGNFNFYDIKSGKYRIATTVEWYVGNKRQGGLIFKEITIKENKSKIKVFITQ